MHPHPINRRSFCKSAAGAVMLGSQLPIPSAQPARPHSAEDELLANAKERIEQHRKADGSIVVRSAEGKPLAGAQVKVEQIRHEFLFGSNFFMFNRNADPAREAAYRDRFAALLNFATLGFYWRTYEPEQGKPNYDYTSGAIDWCDRNGIPCKGHPLAWDHPASSPNWLPEDLAEVERLSTARVRDSIARFQGRIGIWDVVNEPTDLTRFKNQMNRLANRLGPVAFTRLHLKVARAANPGATLLVNDYRTDPPYAQILEALREDGKLPFDAIGIQSHMHGGGWPLRKIWETCDTYAQFNLPLHFTETTIVSGPRLGPGENWGETTPELEAKQADYVTKFYTMLFAHPAVRALTWWDFSDAGAWQRAAAGFLRKDMSPKPVYEALMNLIKQQWWTRLEGTTNGGGEFPARAFAGKQKITIQLPGGATQVREVDWKRDQPNRVEFVAS
jgi:endo-1,4-beta-xylanase